MGYIGNQTSNSYTSITKQTITGNGGASYTLDHAVANVNEIEVFVNNVRQEPAVAYTVSGTALTMTGNVASTDNFYVVFQGKAVGSVVPPDDSVTTARINDGAVTSAKLDTNIDIAGTLDATGIITADAGIKLGGTASANLLNDYEEGTWTPVVSAGINSVTYTDQSGRYTKIGNLVYADFYLRVSGTGSGALFAIDGLPYNIGTGYTRGGGTTSYEDIRGKTGQFYGAPNDNKFNIYYEGNNSYTTTGTITDKYLIGTFTYLT